MSRMMSAVVICARWYSASRFPMAFDEAVAQRVLAGVSGDELAQIGVDLVNCPSPTGQEAPVAEYMLDWFQRHGLKAIRQEVEPGRPNAVGILKGTGGGLS